MASRESLLSALMSPNRRWMWRLAPTRTRNVAPAQAGFALASRGRMVFEYIIRYSPRRRALP